MKGKTMLYGLLIVFSAGLLQAPPIDPDLYGMKPAQVPPLDLALCDPMPPQAPPVDHECYSEPRTPPPPDSSGEWTWEPHAKYWWRPVRLAPGTATIISGPVHSPQGM